jgi:cellulose synthase/poly-beta-1,6-N-acetylglucosamine synthase-like glycosyltransferase
MPPFFKQLKTIVMGFLILMLLTLLLLIMPSRVTWLSFLSALGMTAYFLVYRFKPFGLRVARRLPSVFSAALLILPFVFGYVVALECYDVGSTLALTVIATGLTITFWCNFLTVPLALWHKSLEMREEPVSKYPPLSVIVPAYNEEKVLAKTVEALLEADYPDKEIIVVDDGSTDGTFKIASRYEKFGVKVYRKENGGKYSALNYGLRLARGEIIVTVDADSVVGRMALKELVKKFRNPRVAAVCGNIKVLNRVNWLTNCQALEYVVSINVIRRALDVFGAVTVVPGALGAFRKSVLEAGGAYDRDTVAEDFDVTVKTLKAGNIVQASSYAVAYTEAPQTLRDLYRQRMRWYRGNFQTIIKHRDVFLNPRYGPLYSLSFPFILVSMIFIPFAGLVVWGSVIFMLIKGEYAFIALITAMFTALQLLLSLLAVEIDGEDVKLVAYAPFFVVGYKQLIDIFIVKALFDVLLKRKIEWTRVRRIGSAS